MRDINEHTPGEDLIIEQTAVATEYGTFSILPSGTWEYTLDTMNPDIVALPPGESLVDAIPIASVDGTPMQGLVARLSATPGSLRWSGRPLDADGDAIRSTGWT